MRKDGIQPSARKEPSPRPYQCTAMVPGQAKTPHKASAMLSSSRAVRTECQSTVCCRRSMVKKSSNWMVGAASASSGARQCIRSARDSPSASASGSSVLISGRPMPRSQRLTALSVTVQLFSQLSCVNPVLCASGSDNFQKFWHPFYQLPWKKHSIRQCKRQSTLCLPGQKVFG